MFYVKNIPFLEQAIRVIAGATIAAYALLSIGGMLGWLIFGCGTGAAITGLFGFCPACALAGRRLEKQQHK